MQIIILFLCILHTLDLHSGEICSTDKNLRKNRRWITTFNVSFGWKDSYLNKIPQAIIFAFTFRINDLRIGKTYVERYLNLSSLNLCLNCLKSFELR